MSTKKYYKYRGVVLPPLFPPIPLLQNSFPFTHPHPLFLFFIQIFLRFYFNSSILTLSHSDFQSIFPHIICHYVMSLCHCHHVIPYAILSELILQTKYDTQWIIYIQNEYTMRHFAQYIHTKNIK